MARGKKNIEKYVQVFEKGRKGDSDDDSEPEGTPEELSDELKQEIKKREELQAQLEEKGQTIHELQDRMSNMENLDLEEELRQKVEELNQIKNAYAKKMKNTIALQRIKYEKEIDQVRKDMKKIALTKGGFDEELRKKEHELEMREDKMENKERELDALRDELEDMKSELELARTEGSGNGTVAGDPAAIQEKAHQVSKLEEMVQNREIEIKDLKDALSEEAKKKEAAQVELINVKKGSVAMMKYVTTLQNKKQEEELTKLRETMEGEIEKRQTMEGELQKREEELSQREVDLTKKIEDLSKGKVDLQTVKSLEADLEKKGKVIKKREDALKNREKEIIQKFKSLEAEIKKKIKDGKIIQDVKREFASKEEDLKRVKDLLKEKESELKRRETELEHRLSEMSTDKAMDAEVSRLQKMLAKKDKDIEKLKASGSAAADEDLNEEVTALQELVLVKEDEISLKEETIDKLKVQINKLAKGGDMDVGAVQTAVSEKEAKIKELMLVIKQKDKQLASSSSSSKSSAGMKELFDEVKDLRAKIEMKDYELKKLKDAVAYKDEEITRRETDMRLKEEVLKKEQRKLAEAEKLGGSIEEAQLKKKLEALEMKIIQKEEELQQREKYISMKLEELKSKEGEIVEEDLAQREKDREMEFKEEKIKTGNPRLDDLLYGGIPFGKQILVMGPPFIGKETQVNNFLLEGVIKGIPSLILTTDCSPSDMRDEMKYILPEIEQYEEKGLLKYIDAYSKAMGMDEEDPNVIFVEHPTDYKGINKAIDSITKEFRKFSDYWTMAVRSISTLVTYSDPTTTYRFLQSMTGRAKRNKIVAMYLLDKGMHNEQEIQTLGHLMDGKLEFKTDGVKTFLMVQGICDVQSRAWIQYQYSKRGLNVGSFSLDHIK